MTAHVYVIRRYRPEFTPHFQRLLKAAINSPAHFGAWGFYSEVAA